MTEDTRIWGYDPKTFEGEIFNSPKDVPKGWLDGPHKKAKKIVVVDEPTEEEPTEENTKPD